MKLTVLVDNNTIIDEYYLGEPGLSFYIEDNDTKILFDTGYSDVFLRNADSLNISLDNLDYLVLSHGHNDHTGGLRYIKDKLQNTTLITHPQLFVKRFHEGLEVGSPIDKHDLNVLTFINTKDTLKITDRLYYLGQIDRVNSFENRTIGTLKDNTPDSVIDDSALAYKTDEGLFIITGCSHSGICNIIEKAKKELNEERIIGVIGGFHLMEDNKQLYDTVQYFKRNKITNLYPCHCCNLVSKIKMSKVANVHEVGVGLSLDI